MTSPQAILIGATLIALSVIAANTMHPAEAQRYGGPYQLMHHSNALANAGVFRLDTASGEVSYCFISGDQSLTCSASVK
jgi:hypothetical protein